jgi:outer membrane protein assembly factor BamD
MKAQFFSALTLVLFSVSVAIFSGCSSTPTTADSADQLFAQAEEDLKEERFISALEKYREVKSRFPYSSRAIDAELRIADAFYQQESYIEAESAYEIFKELHPTHTKSDYVQFQIAMSNFKQIPDNSARDLTAALRAIDSFQTLNEKFPNSSYGLKSKELMAEARRRLAEHELYVADFYFDREHFLSASQRYVSLLRDFPNLGYDEEALYRLGKCYFQIRNYSGSRDTLRRLLKEFPQSSHKGDADKIFEDINRELSSKKK